MKNQLILVTTTWRRTGGLETVGIDIANAYKSLGWRIKVIAVFDDDATLEIPGIDVISPCPKSRVFKSIWHRFYWTIGTAQIINQLSDNNTIIIFNHVHLLPIIDKFSPSNKAYKVCWLHGIEVWGNESIRWLPYLNRLEHVVCVSNYTSRQVISAGLVASSRVISPSVDIDLFRPTLNPAKIRRNEILIVGRISAAEKYKGHDALIDSLPMAEDKSGAQLQLRIVGSGDDIIRLKDKVDALNLTDKVIFSGRLPLEDLVEAYQHCTLFCMPSRVIQRSNSYWAGEGFGIVYIEAAACGRPVIASSDGGAAETINPNKTGLLVDPNSIDDISSAIAQLISGPEQADIWGNTGRIFVENHFSPAVFINKLDELAQYAMTTSRNHR